MSGTAALLASLASVGAMFLALTETRGCTAHGGDTRIYRVGCPYKLWAGSSLICALLWAASAFCLARLVWSGRHARGTDGGSDRHPAGTDLEVELCCSRPIENPVYEIGTAVPLLEQVQPICRVQQPPFQPDETPEV